MAHREQFVKMEGSFLPEDLCPFVGEMPTIFEVTPTSEEIAVAVDSRYVKEVCIHIDISSEIYADWLFPGPTGRGLHCKEVI
jgi:hypothetical protein